MNHRFVALGILLLAVGGFALAFPQLLSPPAIVSDRTVLARIAPGNFWAIQVTPTTQQVLQASFTCSPESVDFFLMNSSAFSAVNASAHPPIDIYPQSRLDAKNYTFDVANAESSDGLSLVFIARSSSAFTDVLLHLVVSREPDLTQTFAIPVVIIALGVASLAFGATRTSKPNPKPSET